MEPTIDLLARAPHMNSWFIDLDAPQIVDLFHTHNNLPTIT